MCMSKNEQMILRNKMKRLIITLVSVVLFTVGAHAVQKDQIVPVMEDKISSIITVLQDQTIQKDEKPEKIYLIIDEVFDYRLMSRISLGKVWKKISKEQQNEFIQLFEQKLKQSYVDKLDLYTDEKIKILEAQEVKKNRIKLLTNLIGKDEVYKINYKFYKAKSGEWFIYDVDIIGVSIIQTYRKQFSGFLKDKSFEELLKTL